MDNLHGQLECTETHHGNILLGISLKGFPENFSQGEKCHSECGLHHPMSVGSLAENELSPQHLSLSPDSCSFHKDISSWWTPPSH